MIAHFSPSQYMKLRSLIAAGFGLEEWGRSSKKRKIRIVRRAFAAFRSSAWWPRLIAEVPAVDGHWFPQVTEQEENKLTSLLDELVVRMTKSQAPDEKLDLMEAMYRLMCRLNDKSTLAMSDGWLR